MCVSVHLGVDVERAEGSLGSDTVRRVQRLRRGVTKRVCRFSENVQLSSFTLRLCHESQQPVGERRLVGAEMKL